MELNANQEKFVILGVCKNIVETITSLLKELMILLRGQIVIL